MIAPVVLTFVAALAVLSPTVVAKIPDYIHICHRSDPRVTACIKNSIRYMTPQLLKGIPEYNIPGLDPFKLGTVVLFDGKVTPNLDASLHNVVITGLRNYQIKKLKLDIDKMTYLAEIVMPYLELKGDYRFDIKILSTPVQSQGQFNANATGVTGHVIVQGLLNKDNHLRFSGINFKIDISDFNLEMENLLNGDPILAQAAKEVLSRDKKELIAMASPVIERKCSEILLELSNKITDKLDYDEVFPL